MIKATARSAPDREREINNLIRKADFNNDPFVQEFGLNISHNLMEVWILFSFHKYVLECFNLKFSLLALLVMIYILLSIKRDHNSRIRGSLQSGEPAVFEQFASHMKCNV